MTTRTIVLGATIGLSVKNLMEGQLGNLRDEGWDVHVVASPDAELRDAAEKEGVQAHGLPMVRGISPLRDVVALIQWVKLLRRLRPEVVNLGTPKAALLGLMAARVTRVPTRIYTVRGLRYETTSGPRRRLLWAMEQLAMRASTLAVAVSPSLRLAMINDGLASRPIAVIGQGSSNGVDTSPAESFPTRNDLGLPCDAFVVGFVGRPDPDKGADILLQALEKAGTQAPNLHLMIVGGTLEEFRSHGIAANSVSTGWVGSARAYYPLMDVLCLPTYREGFPNVVLEAAMAQIPAITTTATGAIDSVVDGVTGLIVGIGDVHSLSEAILRLQSDSEQRREMGRAARNRACLEFSRERIWVGLRSLYDGTCDPDVDIISASPHCPAPVRLGR